MAQAPCCVILVAPPPTPVASYRIVRKASDWAAHVAPLLSCVGAHTGGVRRSCNGMCDVCAAASPAAHAALDLTPYAVSALRLIESALAADKPITLNQLGACTAG
jgi:hypothetical protein